MNDHRNHVILQTQNVKILLQRLNFNNFQNISTILFFKIAGFMAFMKIFPKNSTVIMDDFWPFEPCVGCIECRISIFLVEFSGNIGRNGFLTSIASQKIFRPYFQKSRLEYYFLCLFYFSSPYSGHLRSDFVVLLLLLTARSRRTRNVQKSRTRKVKET